MDRHLDQPGVGLTSASTPPARPTHSDDRSARQVTIGSSAPGDRGARHPADSRIGRVLRLALPDFAGQSPRRRRCWQDTRTVSDLGRRLVHALAGDPLDGDHRGRGHCTCDHRRPVRLSEPTTPPRVAHRDIRTAHRGDGCSVPGLAARQHRSQRDRCHRGARRVQPRRGRPYRQSILGTAANRHGRRSCFIGSVAVARVHDGHLAVDPSCARGSRVDRVCLHLHLVRRRADSRRRRNTHARGRSVASGSSAR